MKQTMHVGDNKFLIIYIVTVLLFYTSGVCFAIVYQEIEELNTESGTDISSTQMEIVFFTVAGIACIPIGIWIHKNWKNDLTPYLIAISGSLVLILLYIVYNTIHSINRRSTRRFRNIRYTQQNFASSHNYCRELWALFNNHMEKEDT